MEFEYTVNEALALCAILEQTHPAVANTASGALMALGELHSNISSGLAVLQSEEGGINTKQQSAQHLTTNQMVLVNVLKTIESNAAGYINAVNRALSSS